MINKLIIICAVLFGFIPTAMAQQPVSTCFEFIEPASNFAGTPLGSTLYNYGHRVAHLPDRLLNGPFYISRVSVEVSGFTGSGGGDTIFLLDKNNAFTVEANYPLSQNGDFSYLSLLLDMSYQQVPSGILQRKTQTLDPPVQYIPGQDSIVVAFDAAPSSTPVQVVWFVCGTTTAPAPSFPHPVPAAPPSCIVGGNDDSTYLLLHGSGPNGSVNFQDTSFRNYTTRFYGSAAIQNNYFQLDGSTSLVSPELYGPGYGTDTNPAHNDWNPGSGNFTLDVTANPSAATANGTIVSFGNSFGPLLIVQQGANYVVYSSSAGTSWDIANAVSMGPASLGVDTVLSVTRSGNHLYLFNNGNLVGSPLTVTGPLFYPLSGGLPAGRLALGAQASINDITGVVTGFWWFKGGIKEVRWSKGVARQTVSYSLPAGPYCP